MKNSIDKSFGSSQQEPYFLSLPRARLSLTSQTLSDVPSSIIIRSRIKYGNRRTACKGLFLEYSKYTTIHGIRYMLEVHRPFYEKLFWFVLLTISFGFAILLMLKTYLKWLDSPVILGFDETLVPVHTIPFPTITICPEIKMDTNIFNFSEVSKEVSKEIEKYGAFKNRANLTEEQISQFSASLHICEKDVKDYFAKYIPKNIDVNIAKTLVEISMSKNETALCCRWHGIHYFGDYILTFVATDEGICYQFNGLQYQDIYRDKRYVSYGDDYVVDYNRNFDNVSVKDFTGNWSLDDGYLGQGYHAYPLRTTFASASHAFIALLLGFQHNFENTCRNGKLGYKVFLNSPESVPLTTGNYILLPHDREIIISVLPQYIVSSADLHDMSPDKRQCFFNDERYLRFFRSYSQRNCQIECLANFTISECGCAKFWMPKPLDVPICSLSDITCYTRAQEYLELLLHNQTLRKNVDPHSQVMCDCMPACNSLEYNLEISNGRFHFDKNLKAWRGTYEHNDAVVSRLSVYFKKHQFTAIKRRQIFSVTTLVANCGGIFGLFMGASSFSLIELIYFFSVRLAANLRRRRRIKNKLIKQALAVEFLNNKYLEKR